MANDPTDPNLQSILSAANSLPATSGAPAPELAPPVPPTLTNTPAPILSGPAGERQNKRSALDQMTAAATSAPPTPAASELTFSQPEKPAAQPLPAPTAGDQGTTDLESKIGTPGNIAMGAEATKAEAPKSFLDRLKSAATSVGEGALGATGLQAFAPGNTSTPMQKGQAIMNLLGKIGQVGSAATGSPQQKEQAIERQKAQAAQQLAQAQLQANQEFHQGMLANTRNANDIKQQQADTAAQKVVGAMNAKGYAQEPDGTWRPKTADEILADPMLSQNIELKQAAAQASKAKADLDKAVIEGKTNPNSLTQKNIEAALEQRKHQADAQLALAQAHLQQGENFHADSRQDKSFQFNQGQLDKIRTPIDQRAQRMATLKDSLAQGTPQADALIAPELLTAAAGGAGSGLRMNEAEISRIVGGRNQWQSLLAKAQAWQLDPSKGFALTPSQRVQVGQLIDVMNQRLELKRQVMDTATQALADPSATVDDHRRILSDAHIQLDKIDSLTDVAAAKPTAKPSAGTAKITPPANDQHQQFLNSITYQGQHPVDAASGPAGTIVKMKQGGPWISIATGKPI